MLFNSIDFLQYMTIFFVLYWFVFAKKLHVQNLLTLFASYYFYACWDWRFLFLLIFSTLLDFYSGNLISNSIKQSRKRLWLYLSIGINLGLLGIFKYYNFFIDSFKNILSVMGYKINPTSLTLILPVGISFYTFHGISYVIDLYKKRIDPEQNYINYAVFVSFFPLLVAGPIERATHLLPQIKKTRKFNYDMIINGLRQILWGLVKKIVIADNCAEFANQIFNNYTDFNGSTLILGAFFFAFQIYGDFSGYSDIALGVAKILGFDLLKNFNYPYFSRNITEFWRRWHISLTSWFRDYIYIPLGGSKGSLSNKTKNILLIFIISGLWHGANWTFIFWGFINFIYFIPSIIFNQHQKKLAPIAKDRLLPTLKESIQVLITFSLITFSWIFFRANNLKNALNYIAIIVATSLFQIPKFSGRKEAFITLCCVTLFIVVEWIGREKNHPLELLGNIKNSIIRWSFYLLILAILFFFGNFNDTIEFIYFQF